MGKMIPSSYITCRTAPTSRPVQVKVIKATTTSLDVSWLPPQKPDNAEVINIQSDKE